MENSNKKVYTKGPWTDLTVKLSGDVNVAFSLANRLNALHRTAKGGGPYTPQIVNNALVGRTDDPQVIAELIAWTAEVEGLKTQVNYHLNEAAKIILRYREVERPVSIADAN